MLVTDDMALMELHIDCGEQHTPVFIKAACENDDCKLQVLDIRSIADNRQPICDQLIEIMPKMKKKLESLLCFGELCTNVKRPLFV